MCKRERKEEKKRLKESGNFVREKFAAMERLLKKENIRDLRHAFHHILLDMNIFRNSSSIVNGSSGKNAIKKFLWLSNEY